MPEYTSYFVEFVDFTCLWLKRDILGVSASLMSRRARSRLRAVRLRPRLRRVHAYLLLIISSISRIMNKLTQRRLTKPRSESDSALLKQDPPSRSESETSELKQELTDKIEMWRKKVNQVRGVIYVSWRRSTFEPGTSLLCNPTLLVPFGYPR